MSNQAPLIEIEKPGPVMVWCRYVCPECGKSERVHAKIDWTVMLVLACDSYGHSTVPICKVGEIRAREWSEDPTRPANVPASATRTPPTKEGWFWHFDLRTGYAEILRVFESTRSVEGGAGLCAVAADEIGHVYLIRSDPVFNRYDGWWIEVAPPK